MRRGIVRLLAGCLLLLLPAVAALAQADQPKKREPPPPSGFLGDYSALEPGPKDGPLLVYAKEPGILAGYDRFLLDPVLVYFHPEAAGVGVDPAELKMLVDFLRDETVEALEKAGYEVVDEPGPGVARLRAAVTDVEGIDPEKNLGTKAVGMAVGVGLLVPSVDVGRASIEVEILDSASGERLVALVDAKKGRRFLNVSKGARTWGDVKGAFKKWAKELRQRLDEVHGRGGRRGRAG